MPRRSKVQRKSKRGSRVSKKSNVIVVNTTTMSIQLNNAKTRSKRLRKLQIPHTLNENVLRFMSFDDMKVLLDDLKIKIDSPPPPSTTRMQADETYTQKDSTPFWRGYTAGALSFTRPTLSPTSRTMNIERPPSNTSHEYDLVTTLHRGSKIIDNQTNAIKKFLKSTEPLRSPVPAQVVSPSKWRSPGLLNRVRSQGGR
jgi:hypothetical protein